MNPSEMFTGPAAAFAGVVVFGFTLVLAITWLIFPFIIMGRLKRIIGLLETQTDLAERTAAPSGDKPSIKYKIPG